MIKNLVIVESPAKARTIEKFLGKDFVVRSCYGHIRDLAAGELSVDIQKNFAPKYEVPADKKKLVSELRKLAKEAEQIWLATDEDREGEAISWHLLDELKLDKKEVKRIVFHEITKPAILRAIENPRSIDENLVNAQQARRVLDRLVGFELSPVLWKKVQPSLSAGRVQSVSVRLIVEREREINAHNAESSFKITAAFHPVDERGDATQAILRAELPRRLETEADAQAFLEKCRNAAYHIEGIEVKPGYKSPSAPFTTSTLQQEASRKLGYGVTRTMSLAQKLYEAGHITYMRTDSVNLSELALNDIEREVVNGYGTQYSHRRTYVTKNAGAQEAHEAIRPTYIGNQQMGSDDAERKLYELIRKRTLASQMANAQLEKTTVKIDIDKHPGQPLQATGEVLIFDGFLKVYLEGHDDEEDEDIKGMLPPLKQGQRLEEIQLEATQKFTRPAPRYTEASLVKKLEELGIGRPSTYAPTITTIQKRGYVVKGDLEGYDRAYTVLKLKDNEVRRKEETEKVGRDKNKLMPSNIGMVVNDFLTTHFKDIMDYRFTATVEKEFDDIARGSVKWQNMLRDFYGPFHTNVEDTLAHGERAKGERTLGTEEKTGKPIVAKVGRYGPMVQIGSAEDEEKPRYAKLRPGQLIESITLEEAMELFRLPRDLGLYESEPVIINIGRFGPYVAAGKEFFSLPKGEDPLEITYERATEIIRQGREAKANKTIHSYEWKDKPLMVLNGRFGPYITYEKLNYKIPKTTEAASLSAADAIRLVEEQMAAGGGTGRGKKAAATKETATRATKSSASKKTSTSKKTTSGKAASPRRPKSK